MSAMTRVWLLAFALGACRRAPPPPVAREAGAASAAPRASVVLPRAEPSCEVAGPVRTIEDGHGRASEQGHATLENLRVLASGGAALVTWERQSRFSMGDSWRAPLAAVEVAGAAFRTLEFPVEAYACASYGSIAPFGGGVAAWGVANTRGFEFWNELPRTRKNEHGSKDVTPKSSRTVFTRKSEVVSFVISGRVALATTFDGACDVPCTCAGPQKPALWLYGLDAALPFSARLALGTVARQPGPDNDVPNSPALVLGPHGGAAAFRAGRALHLSWLDPAGKPQGKPLLVDQGDVGAPALALAGRDLVVVWARRDAPSDPYRLRWMRLAPQAAPAGARELPIAASAFAPAVLSAEREFVLAWMEGDAARRGSILVARIRFDAPRPIGGVISAADETNARDPELSGTIDAPVLAYASFSSARPGGAVRFARLRCIP